METHPEMVQGICDAADHAMEHALHLQTLAAGGVDIARAAMEAAERALEHATQRMTSAGNSVIAARAMKEAADKFRANMEKPVGDADYRADYGQLEVPRDGLNNIVESLEQWQSDYADSMEHDDGAAIDDAIGHVKRAARAVEDLLLRGK